MRFSAFLITICVASQAHATSHQQREAALSADELAQVGALTQKEHDYSRSLQEKKKLGLEPVVDRLDENQKPEDQVGLGRGKWDVLHKIGAGDPYKYAKKDYAVVKAGYDGARVICDEYGTKRQIDRLSYHKDMGKAFDYTKMFDACEDYRNSLPAYLESDGSFEDLKDEVESEREASETMVKKLADLKELRVTLKAEWDPLMLHERQMLQALAIETCNQVSWLIDHKWWIQDTSYATSEHSNRDLPYWKFFNAMQGWACHQTQGKNYSRFLELQEQMADQCQYGKGCDCKNERGYKCTERRCEGCRKYSLHQIKALKKRDAILESVKDGDYETKKQEGLRWDLKAALE